MYDVNFKPSVKQWKAWELLTDSNTNFVGYGGSARSGKTYLAANYLTIMALSYPDTGWGLGRKELKNLKRTTLLTLFKVFDEAGLVKDVHYKYNQQNQVISFYNKSDIFLIDTAYQPSDPLYTRFGGFELTGCVIDESNETPLEGINILFSRIGWRNNDTYNINRCMLETFNPDKGHVYNRYYKPYRDKKEKDNVKFIPALPADNPHPSTKAWIEDMKRNADAITIQRLVYGNFEYDDDPRKIFDYDCIVNMYTNDFIPNGETYISCDVARFGDDKTVIGVWSGLRLEKIVTLKQSGVNEVVDAINQLRREYRVSMNHIVIDEDGVGGGVKDYLRGSKGFVNNSKPVKVNRQQQNFNNLKSQCYFKLAELINTNKLYVNCNDNSIVELITQELEVVRAKEIVNEVKLSIESKDKVKELIGRSPDYSDMMAMRMFFELKGNSSTYSFNK